MPGEYRNVWSIVVRNFINSFRPRQLRGNNMDKRTYWKFPKILQPGSNKWLVGKDYIGNTYYEIPSDPSIGKRKPTRWYDPARGLDFQDPIPAEWEAWLRMRRPEPPTEEEIAKNVAIAQMKKINAAKIEEKRLAEGGSLPSIPDKGHSSFPTYKEYSTGDPENKGNQ